MNRLKKKFKISLNPLDYQDINNYPIESSLLELISLYLFCHI